ncbi:unnamed protein product [Caenorhabditis bovis]|uniref:Uncharacterized protein n=1 Tax=Caenorhabditis bovis TaxID=2654633 RepID=A0A8S1EJS8_9PELO|nr:unnamed protein product [Caenorhabditis bovis]
MDDGIVAQLSQMLDQKLPNFGHQQRGSYNQYSRWNNQHGRSPQENRRGYQQDFSERDRYPNRRGRGNRGNRGNRGYGGYGYPRNPWRSDSPRRAYESQRTSRQQTPERGGPRVHFNNPTVANILPTILILAAIITSASAQEAQICGFSEGGTRFAPPAVPECGTSETYPVMEMTASVYQRRTTPIAVSGGKCTKNLIKIDIFSIFGIYTKSTIVERKMESTSIKECKEVVSRKEISGRKMIQLAPNVYQTPRMEDTIAEHTPTIGTTTITHWDFTLELGTVATYDGKHAISNLGELDNCPFPAGGCKKQDKTIIWTEIITEPICGFRRMEIGKVLVSPTHIAIPEAGIFTAIDEDLETALDLTKYCDMRNPYPTDSGLIIDFPKLPRKTYIPDYIITNGNQEDRTGLPRSGRYRRETYQLTIAGREIKADLGEPFKTPISWILWNVTDYRKAPKIETHPIKDRRLLTVLKRWNVTNELLAIRHMDHSWEEEAGLLVTLKAIRYQQYAQRELNKIDQLRRQLTRGEQELRTAIVAGNPIIFEPLLTTEFGQLPSPPQGKVTIKPPPFFSPEDMKNITTKSWKEETLENMGKSTTTNRPTDIYNDETHHHNYHNPPNNSYGKEERTTTTRRKHWKRRTKWRYHKPTDTSFTNQRNRKITENQKPAEEPKVYS